MTEVAAKVGVSRQTLHSWLARYRDGGLGGLVDRSHRPSSGSGCARAGSAGARAAASSLGRGPGQAPHESRVRPRAQLTLTVSSATPRIPA